MRKSRFTDEQIVAIVQEGAAGAKTGELIRRHGISRETYYKWRRKYGGLKVDEAKRLRSLEDENRRLKRVVADQALNLQVLKDLLGKHEDASDRRAAVRQAMSAAELSERQACRYTGFLRFCSNNWIKNWGQVT